jgi:hypothetical protein
MFVFKGAVVGDGSGRSCEGVTSSGRTLAMKLRLPL